MMTISDLMAYDGMMIDWMDELCNNVLYAGMGTRRCVWSINDAGGIRFALAAGFEDTPIRIRICIFLFGFCCKIS